MERAYSFFLSVLVLQLYFLETCISKNINTDQSALLAFKTSFTLNSSHPLTQNWSSQASVCHWIGVTCGTRHRRVRALNISNMDILGTIPPHLGNLSFLVSLDVSRNHLHGEIPKDIGNLRNLKELVFVNNHLTGSIPFSIFNISSLETLALTYNELSGSLPVDICHRLQRIKIISIISNRLSGHIPTGLSKCTDLYDLSLSYNSFEGTIPPEIVNLERLEFLNLGGNNLQDNCPGRRNDTYGAILS
ncbi:hypothetical protein RND71_033597 [Anisodus tanguticus]|uniref:Leucine-rich repeat-containing N-terminal plant-type domain-containing protein n=1 Tax=Anisodus tanguticus TaxID=243964 RepID=A0AAE1UWA6_9SOLA|nr:hypothetical protein RND71_033597 [Anisodus tanguticus]